MTALTADEERMLGAILIDCGIEATLVALAERCNGLSLCADWAGNTSDAMAWRILERELRRLSASRRTRQLNEAAK